MPETLVAETAEDSPQIYQLTWRECFPGVLTCHPRRLLGLPSTAPCTFKSSHIQGYLQHVAEDTAGRGSCLALQNNRMMENMKNSWRFASTDCGFYCMVPKKTSKAGGHVAVMHGGKVPLVLRLVRNKAAGHDDKNSYAVVGPAYVHGFVDGQARQWVEKGMLDATIFTLV